MYRYIHQWDHWLSGYLGQQILTCEEKSVAKLTSKSYGKQAVLIGVPAQSSLLQATQTMKHFLVTPLYYSKKKYIEADWNELPLLTGSVDLVMMPHCLELSENPHQLLSEACRIVKPEGFIIIFGFNPHSLWGLKKLKSLHHHHFIAADKIQSWLSLEDFELKKHKTLFFRPPLDKPKFMDKLQWLDWLGDKLFLPFGGIYILMAQAKVLPLTPMRVHWKQQLAGVRVAMPGQNIRISL